MHPVTGQPADGYWQYIADRMTDKRHPRWTKKTPRVGPVRDRYFSPPEAAALIGRSRAAIYNYIKTQRLRATWAPGIGPSGKARWFIKGADLIAFVEQVPNFAANATFYGER